MLQNYYLFGVGYPRGTRVFSKLQGLLYHFSENFRCNLTFYQSENFFPLSTTFQNPKNLSFPFSAKNGVTWLVRYEKLNLGNFVGDLLDKLGKLFMDGTFIYKFLAVLRQKKVLGNICFSEQILYRKQ